MQQEQAILLESGTNELEILEFYVDGRDNGRHAFGVNVAKVLEVIESPGLKSVEFAPHPCYMGVISLRGAALPVLDLAIWLRLDRAPQAHDVIMVTEINKLVTGFLVSGVIQIHRVSWAEVEPPGHYLSNMEGNCITALVKRADRFIQLLDLERLLAELGRMAMDAAPQAAAGAGAGRRPRALIVDDSSSIRSLLVQNLTAANFEVRTAGNGEEALAMLLNMKASAADQDRPMTDFVDVVVSDVEMPRMDGYTLTRRIKEDPTLKGLPVILFSSLISESIRHKGWAVGADDQISKPEFGELAQRAATLIRTAPGSGTARAL